MPARVLISGCNGFVGGYLSLFLKKKGLDVFGIDVQDASRLDWLNYRKVDICDAAAVLQYIKGNEITQVYHLAAVADPKVAHEKPASAVSVNVMGTLSFFEACRAIKGLMLLVVGSAEEYKSKVGDNIIYTELDALDARTIYGATKISAEAIGRAYSLRYELPICFTRSFNHSGPGQSTAYVLSSFAKQCADISKGVQQPEIHVGNLNVKRDFLDVEDVIEAYYAIMQKGKPGAVYNVGSRQPYLLKDLLNLLVSYIGRADIKIIIDQTRIRSGETETIHGDSSLLFEDTAWEPKIQIQDTLRKLYDYWIAQK